jgi:hypothetical protein
MYDFNSYNGGILIGVLIVLFILLIPFILYLVTLQNTLKAISPENRRMPPGNVWLLFIPIFNYVWQFFVVSYIADSIAAECVRLNIPVTEKRPTFGIGTAKNILSLVGLIIPIVGPLATFVCWIIYWAKVNQYKNLIIANKDNFLLDAERQIFNTSS